ncbi:MAG: SUMF1/EgtB/PvdO family nonheme iron enzyme [Phycisphaerales bacterium]|nr:SUMF1/EgtB/PvdO family nonheme iron enzyme [Phycisphaerales bacterium]
MRHLVIMAGALASAGLLFGVSSASATVTFNWATVGNPGNAADTATGSLYGSVDHTYQISKTEVTNAQYVEFLNAVDPSGANTHSLYNGYMSDYPGYVAYTGGINYTAGNAAGAKYTVKAGEGNQPVIWVSWNDAARFTNWLSNGQGSGGTESGVYDMTQSFPSRAAGAQVFLPTEDEWYKAAYYDPTLNSGSGGYYTYATLSNTAPISQAPAGGSNSANYINNDGVANGINGGYAVTGSTSFNSSQDYLTDVGAYTGSTSYYGTFDQNGNVWEWNETLISGSSRGMRGGSWSNGLGYLAASYRLDYAPATETANSGFRMASVPEPGSCVVLLSMAGMALMRRRRIA